MEEHDLYNWARIEKSKTELQEMPADVDDQLVELFKKVNAGKSEIAKKNCRDLVFSIYSMRELKILHDARNQANGYSTVFPNMNEREKKILNELIKTLEEGRRSILSFLGIPFKEVGMEYNEFSPEYAEEKKKGEIKKTDGWREPVEKDSME